MILAEGSLVPVPTKREKSFEIEPDQLEKAITPNTKCIVLVSPSNPTGGVIQRSTLERIAELSQEHDLLVISDEWRVGYVTAASEIIEAMLPIHHCMNICAAAASQWAALAALTGPHDWFDDVLADYDRRRRMWMRALDEMGLPYGYPQGAYYIMFDVTSTGLSSREFAQTMRAEAQVVVGGGGGSIDPSTEGFCRGSFVTPIDKLEEGLARIKSVVTELKARK
jgi:aminotransferase